MTDRHKILIASDDAHEKVFAEIQINGRFLALVSQRKVSANSKSNCQC